MKNTQIKNLVISLLFSLSALLFFYFPTTQLDISFFHNDDFLLINKLNSLSDSSSVFKYIFNIDAYKFRPISNLQYYFEHYFFQGNFTYYIYYNIFLVLSINFILLLCIGNLVNLLQSVLISLALVTSKFLVYPLWNITGSFESLAVIFFLLLVFLVTNSKFRATKYKFILVTLLLIFTSERYLPFLCVLPIILEYKKTHSLQKSIYSKIYSSLAIFSAFVLLRYLLNIPLIVGAEVDNVLNTFSPLRFIFHLSKSYIEILGASIGPRYLTGSEFLYWVPLPAWPTFYKISTFCSVILIFSSFYYFFFKNNFRRFLTFNSFILIMAIAASVTFRLELRWLIPCYIILLLILATNIKELPFSKKSPNLNIKFFYVYIIFLLVYNLIYQIYFKGSIYFAGKLQSIAFFTKLIN